jgi:hypothetical protein
MIAEILVWGFFSAMGWMAANWTVDRVMSEKTETQTCSEWREERQANNVVERTRTCEPKK